MINNAIYDRLRSIGVSVETADALAPVVAGLSPRKREAFFLWAMGMSYRRIAKETKMPKSTVCDLVKNIRTLFSGIRISKV
jgi:DNA-directed RNA polymerase specialized sigma24 family protein